MRWLSHIFLTAFFLLSAANLVCCFMDWGTGVLLTKPLLMPSLASWFFLATGRLSKPFHQMVFFGLICSFSGDCLLMFADENPDYFLFGLGSFLIAHLFYIAAFWKFPGWEKGMVMRKWWPLMPVLLYLAAMLFYLWPDLPKAFKMPVAIYSMVICAMFLSALNMKGRVEEKKALWLAFGALLFVLSDSLIAVGKFKEVGLSPEVLSVGIMATYLAGQFLIASSSRHL